MPPPINAKLDFIIVLNKFNETPSIYIAPPEDYAVFYINFESKIVMNFSEF
jgi:hypothetical protein